ncbi:hypothetical protein QYM36_000051, partial [Artemia franciscana]
VIEQKWAVNREHLMLEKVLGEGEFGKVMQARLLTDKGLKIVAVKMAKVNRGGDAETAIQDLWSEFSLLKDVDHLHVIRLIGACSTNNELMLVLEYAEHGSLRNYLRKSRTEAVRHTIELDYPVSPRDILCFAWQISKGMAYLASMKLVHRDLAARNVLVANGNIAKISDFGLTRDIYEEDAYFKRSKGRVPVKWMAPESLADQLYTTKSDVWSFGILLWELCTLGSTPYPGLGPEKLYRLLKSGYRMERPDNCSQELYSIMLHCWKDSPSDRPSFHELALILDRMLADGVNYLDIFSLIVNNPGYIGCLESEEEDDETLASKDSVKEPGSQLCYPFTQSSCSFSTEYRPLKDPRLTSLKRGTGGRSSFSGDVVTVFGATGFIGKYLCNKLGKIGCQVIIPNRGDEYDVLRLKMVGDLGQVLFVPYYLRDDESLRKAMKYSTAVVNLVGRDWETKNFKFDDVNIDGAARIARIAKEMDVPKLIHVSSMNATEEPEGHILKNGSKNLATKWAGELAVREEFPDATIFRPSDVFGSEDRFIRNGSQTRIYH